MMATSFSMRRNGPHFWLRSRRPRRFCTLMLVLANICKEGALDIGLARGIANHVEGAAESAGADDGGARLSVEEQRKSTLAIADFPTRYNVEVLPTAPFLVIPEVVPNGESMCPSAGLRRR